MCCLLGLPLMLCHGILWIFHRHFVQVQSVGQDHHHHLDNYPHYHWLIHHDDDKTHHPWVLSVEWYIVIVVVIFLNFVFIPVGEYYSHWVNLGKGMNAANHII